MEPEQSRQSTHENESWSTSEWTLKYFHVVLFLFRLSHLHEHISLHSVDTALHQRLPNIWEHVNLKADIIPVPLFYFGLLSSTVWPLFFKKHTCLQNHTDQNQFVGKYFSLLLSNLFPTIFPSPSVPSLSLCSQTLLGCRECSAGR